MPRVVESVRPYMLTNPQESDELTIGIHSRHIHPEVDGSDVDNELNCLDMVLDLLRYDGSQPCTILVMADRALTLQGLSEAVDARGCTPIVVEHDTETPKVEKDGALLEAQFRNDYLAAINEQAEEHGPFRGGGFFRDWYVVSQARSAFIHYKDRSSSEIVYDRMVYQGRIDGPVHSPLPRCEIDSKSKKLNLIQ